MGGRGKDGGLWEVTGVLEATETPHLEKTSVFILGHGDLAGDTE